MAGPTCRSCSKPITFLKTRSGKNMPCDVTTESERRRGAGELFERGVADLVSHFDTCPNAAHHRKKKSKAASP